MDWAKRDVLFNIYIFHGRFGFEDRRCRNTKKFL